MNAANTGNDRGEVNDAIGTRDTDTAEQTHADSDKTGVSAKKVAAGAAGIAAGVAAVAAVKKKADSEDTEDTTRDSNVEAVPVAPGADLDTSTGTTADREGRSL